MIEKVGYDESFVNNYLWGKKNEIITDKFLVEISKMCTHFDPSKRPTF